MIHDPVGTRRSTSELGCVIALSLPSASDPAAGWEGQETCGHLFSRASAKAEHGLSSLSYVWMYVDQKKGTPLEIAYPLGIP